MGTNGPTDEKTGRQTYKDLKGWLQKLICKNLRLKTFSLFSLFKLKLNVYIFVLFGLAKIKYHLV